MEKKLKRICKKEEENLKLLEIQERELLQLKKENDKMVQQQLEVESSEEKKIKKEIEHFRGKIDKLSNKLSQVIEYHSYLHSFEIIKQLIKIELKTHCTATKCKQKMN